MSRAAIFSFMPVLTKILPESITNIERGRYYRNRFHEITDKWIREHRQEYRGNRSGDIQDAYLDRINAGEEHFSSEVTTMIQVMILTRVFLESGRHCQGDLCDRGRV